MLVIFTFFSFVSGWCVAVTGFYRRNGDDDDDEQGRKARGKGKNVIEERLANFNRPVVL